MNDFQQVVGHNHTYTLPQASGATPRSQTRDKKNSKKAEEEHLSRDEKRARALNVSVSFYSNPFHKFNVLKFDYFVYRFQYQYWKSLTYQWMNSMNGYRNTISVKLNYH